MIDPSKLRNEELIRILECPEDYIPELQGRVVLEIDNRGVADAEKNRIASNLYREKLRPLFKVEMYMSSKFNLPFSKILSEEQKVILYEAELNNFIQLREDQNRGLQGYSG